ncbi:glyoxylate reductase [Roseibium sp. TrichSKD4]|nr:glyoxylate reductase [Roseibium sp. TrichSKD4]
MVVVHLFFRINRTKNLGGSMAQPLILLANTAMPIVENGLAQHFKLRKAYETPEMDTSALAAEVQGVTLFQVPIDAAFLDKFPNLKIVANFSVGYDCVDTEACAARNIMVTNTPDVLTEEVADTAIGLMISAVRQFGGAERWVQSGQWASKGPYPLSPGTLRGRTLGVYGLGSIGKAIAKRAEAFGMSICYHGRSRQMGVDYAYCETLVELAECCDTVMVATPGTPENQNAISDDVLKALGANGVLVNIGRGSVVDEPALIRALDGGIILGAGLDVFANEPHVPPALLNCGNVVVLPHIGSASIYTRDAMGQLVVDNLVSWFETGKAVTPVPETAHLQGK